MRLSALKNYPVYEPVIEKDGGASINLVPVK